MKTKTTQQVNNFKLSAIQAVLTTTLLCSTFAYANEDTINTSNNSSETIASKADETIVITANRTPQLLSSVLNSVEIFNRDDIELSSAQSLGEILNNINGLQLSQNGGAGQAATIYTRGTNAGHTLVVIDGQRVGSATLGQVEFAKISPEQIERIEVIKGPRAALWGSDAIGGVIQIFTRQLESGEVVATVGLGNDDQQQASVSTALAHGDGRTTVTISANSSDGYDVKETTSEDDADDDGYNRENISIVGSQALNKNWTLKWLAKYNQGETESDGSTRVTEFDGYQWQLSAIQKQDDFFQEFIVGKQNSESNSFGTRSPSLFETTRSQASWLGNYQFTKAFSSTVGLDFYNEEVETSGSAYTEDERDNYAAFIRGGYNNNGLILDASLRYDDIENIDSELTYNASIGHTFSESSLISLNIGSGFKAPSFNDLYYPEDTYSVGNDSLVSETSDTIELLIKHNIDNLFGEISFYKTKVDNLIDWNPDAVTGKYTPENVEKAKIQGVEVTLNTEYLGFKHEIQWGYLDAKNDLTDERLIRRAKNTASYHLSKHWDKLSLRADVNYQGKRLDSQWPGTTTVASHTIVNFGSSYQVASDWKLNLKVNNLFDKDYVSAITYVGQPRQVLLSVTYQN